MADTGDSSDEFGFSADKGLALKGCVRVYS